MKKLTWILSLMLLLVSAGMASAHEIFYAGAGPWGVTVAATFPGMRFVYGRPGVYCWYRGHYYSREGWDRFRRFDRDRYAYYRFHRDDDRGYYRDGGRNNHLNNDRGLGRDDHRAEGRYDNQEDR